MAAKRAQLLIERHKKGTSAEELLAQISDQTVLSESLAQFGANRKFYKDGRLTESAIIQLRDHGFSAKRILSMTINESLLILKNGGVPLESMDYAQAIAGICHLGDALIETKSQERAQKLLKAIIELGSSSLNSLRNGVPGGTFEEITGPADDLVITCIGDLHEAFLSVGELSYIYENDDALPVGINKLKFLVTEVSRSAQRLDNKLHNR